MYQGVHRPLKSLKYPCRRMTPEKVPEIPWRKKIVPLKKVGTPENP